MHTLPSILVSSGKSRSGLWPPLIHEWRHQVEWMLDHLVQRLEDGSLPMDRIDRSVERCRLYCVLYCLQGILAYSCRTVLCGRAELRGLTSSLPR